MLDPVIKHRDIHTRKMRVVMWVGLVQSSLAELPLFLSVESFFVDELPKFCCSRRPFGAVKCLLNAQLFVKLTCFSIILFNPDV